MAEASKGFALKTDRALESQQYRLKTDGEGTILGAFLDTLLMSIIISSLNLLGVGLN